MRRPRRAEVGVLSPRRALKLGKIRRRACLRLIPFPGTGDVLLAPTMISHPLAYVVSNPRQPQCQFLFFAIFVFQVFPLRKLPEKFRKNYIKNQRSGSFHAPEGEPEGGHQGSRRPGGAAPLQAAPGGAWAPQVSSDAPFGLYLTHVPKP